MNHRVPGCNRLPVPLDYGVLGWLTGFEPVLAASQADVLPLHYSHHVRQPQSTRLDCRYWLRTRESDPATRAYETR